MFTKGQQVFARGLDSDRETAIVEKDEAPDGYVYLYFYPRGYFMYNHRDGIELRDKLYV